MACKGAIALAFGLFAAASGGLAAAEDVAETCADGSCPAQKARPGQAGVNLMQRAYMQSELGQASDTSGTDYDCDDDGVPDCGKWDYTMSMCNNQLMCGHRYKFPDGTLDQSCRCRRCAASPRTAQGDPKFLSPEDPKVEAPFKALGWGTFKNWADHMNTCAPWIMPKDDGDIRSLLVYARERGYKVRISGAGHSAGGIVTDGKDDSVVVMSLAEYTASGEWEFGIKDMPDGSKRATANAGWTQFHLYERVRPLGFFLPAQTAGYFFSLGGIVANSVHGGSYKAGFVHGYATRMRVMHYDGTVRIVDDEEEMRYWRCSFGLLGIILGIEFQLEKREALQMYSVDRKLDSWSSEEFWKFIKQDAEADMPSEILPADGGAGTRKAWNGEFFADFINGGETPKIAVYAQKANSSVDENFGGQLGIPEDIHEQYATIKNRGVTDGWHGQMSWGEAARRDGSPPIKIMGMGVNDILEGMKGLKGPMAHVMSDAAMTSIPRLARALGNKVNDGFFLTHAPAALAAAYFVAPDKAFAAMDFLRKVQMESLDSKEFVWNLPGEFRFINVQDTAVLQPIPKGIWFNAQMISFADLAKTHQAWKKDFKKVEDFWVKELKAQPHMGKLFGFETGADGAVEPFADSYCCTIYSDEQKASFEAYRHQQDPEGLFATGLGMKFLAPCAN